MKNRLLMFAAMISIVMMIGCRVLPDKPEDYAVKVFFEGEKMLSLISFSIDNSEAELAKIFKDGFAEFKQTALLIPDSKDAVETDNVACLDDDDVVRCIVSVDANIEIENVLALSLFFKAIDDPNREDDLFDVLIGANLPDVYFTPELTVYRTFFLGSVKLDDPILDVGERSMLTEFLDGRTSLESGVDIRDICERYPGACILDDTDVDNDVDKGEDTDPVDDETPEDGDNLLGYGGSCTLMPTGAGQGIAGVLFMMLSLVPAVLKRKLK